MCTSNYLNEKFKKIKRILVVDFAVCSAINHRNIQSESTGVFSCACKAAKDFTGTISSITQIADTSIRLLVLPLLLCGTVNEEDEVQNPNLSCSY